MRQSGKTQQLKIFGRTFISVLLAELLMVYAIDANTVLAYADQVNPQVEVAQDADMGTGSDDGAVSDEDGTASLRGLSSEGISSLYAQFTGSADNSGSVPASEDSVALLI